MTKEFNRKYTAYQPGGPASGPPTERICKPDKCGDKSSTPTPPPTPPTP
jgi:hypothetical protein